MLFQGLYTDSYIHGTILGQTPVLTWIPYESCAPNIPQKLYMDSYFLG